MVDSIKSVPSGYGLVDEGRIRSGDLVFDSADRSWVRAEEFDLKGGVALVHNAAVVVRRIFTPKKPNSVAGNT
jgi:hypothetical protein